MPFRDDEPVVGDEIVRSFMVTGGKARSHAAAELPLETRVELASDVSGALAQMQFERKAIVGSLTEPKSIVEIAASLQLPILTAQVLVSELVAEGTLVANESATDIDLGVLESIRAAIVSL